MLFSRRLLRAERLRRGLEMHTLTGERTAGDAGDFTGIHMDGMGENESRVGVLRHAPILARRSSSSDILQKLSTKVGISEVEWSTVDLTRIASRGHGISKFMRPSLGKGSGSHDGG